MPLQIAYRPVVLPPAAALPRADAASEPVAGACDEARPRDFAARIRRRDMGSAHRVLHRPTHLYQRIAGIVLIGALSALLAMTGWGDPRGVSGALAQVRVADMPIATMAAPASASDRTLAAIHSDAASGPAARPIMAAGNELDRTRALQCLTAAIYYEAAREPDEGQHAVAQVVLNRVAHPAFPKTVCGVVYQGSERPGCQFSFACDGSLAHVPVPAYWARARRVAEAALAGEVYAPIGFATHYHTSAVHPGWADSMNFVGMIGAHRFYRWSGSAGEPRAFSAVYAGAEPLAAPHPRSWISTGADFADPLVLEKAFEAGRLAALRTAGTTQGAQPADPAIVRAGVSFGQQPLPQAAPALPDPATHSRILPGSGNVRPDAEQQYDNAATWIHQPGA